MKIEICENEKLMKEFFDKCGNGIIVSRLASYRLDPDGHFTEGKWGKVILNKKWLKDNVSLSDLSLWGLTEEEILHINGDINAKI
jgi:hypothetical protein